jgi:hypothetical protein
MAQQKDLVVEFDGTGRVLGRRTVPNRGPALSAAANSSAASDPPAPDISTKRIHKTIN